MGWNTSALFVRDRTVDDVIAFLPDVYSYEPTGEVVSSEQAHAGSPGGRLYAAVTPTREASWCELWDPEQRLATRVEKLIELDGPGTLQGTTALAVIFSSVTSTYGFWLFEDGELKRRVMYETGECIDESGDRLPVEDTVEVPSWGHDEDFVWALIASVAEIELDDARSYAVFSVDT